MTRFAVLCATAVIGGAFAGCGASQDQADSSPKAAAKRTALDRKLHHLQLELRRQRRAERHAEHEQKQSRLPEPAYHGVAKGPLDFAGLQSRLDGVVGISIGASGSDRVLSAGDLTSGSAWSTIKVPIALRVLQDAGGPSGLSSSQADEIRAALTLSDNDAAAALFASLERAHGGVDGAAEAVDAILRQGGDSTTRVSTQGRNGFSPYGQTEWSLALQQQFMSRLAEGCIGMPASRNYVLDLMGEVTSDGWGLGSAGLPARWKGGWGPGVDGRYLVRQMGILNVGDREAAVTLATIPANGDFETAQVMATALARWLARRAPHFAALPGGC